MAHTCPCRRFRVPCQELASSPRPEQCIALRGDCTGSPSGAALQNSTPRLIGSADDKGHSLGSVKHRMDITCRHRRLWRRRRRPRTTRRLRCQNARQLLASHNVVFLVPNDENQILVENSGGVRPKVTPLSRPCSLLCPVTTGNAMLDIATWTAHARSEGRIAE